MTARTPVEALARALGDLVAAGDLAQVLATVLDDVAEGLDADAVGALVRSATGELEALTATSHRVAELEVYQAQHEEGPCVEAVQTRVAVTAVGADEIIQRWPEPGRAIVSAGFTSVHAFPLRWDHEVFGAINVFHRSPATNPDLSVVGQAFADIISSILVRPSGVRNDVLAGRISAALSSRTVIEQAKGVLSYQHGVEMDAAYDLLRQRAAREERALSEVARQVVTQPGRARAD
jgi:hypothetical protein